MKLPFLNHYAERELRKPAPASLPQMEILLVAAQYRGARKGGDFFDFIQPVQSRLVFTMLDIAGKRDEALNIAAFVQDKLRVAVPKTLGIGDVNEAEAVSNLNILINRTIMEAAGGVRCAPAFIASYDEALGTLTYINSGHTPALVLDGNSVSQLKASGVPLGLFSHAVTDAQLCVLGPGSILLLVSKGLVESRTAFHKEFGIERVEEVLKTGNFSTAFQLCSSLLGAVEAYTKNNDPENDVTTVAFMRPAAAQASAG